MSSYDKKNCSIKHGEYLSPFIFSNYMKVIWKADDIKSLFSNSNYYLLKNLNHFVKKDKDLPLMDKKIFKDPFGWPSLHGFVFVLEF